MTFLGWRLLPDRTRVVGDNVTAFRRQMMRLREEEDYGRGLLKWAQVAQRVQAWIAHAAHGDT